MTTFHGQMRRGHRGRAAPTQVRCAPHALVHATCVWRWVAVWEGAEGDGGLGRGWSGRIHLSHGLGRPHGAGDGARRRCGGSGGSPRRACRPIALTARVRRVPQVRKLDEGLRGVQELGEHPLSSSSTARCGASVADTLRGRRRVVRGCLPARRARLLQEGEGGGRRGRRGRRRAGMGLRRAGPSPP